MNNNVYEDIFIYNGLTFMGVDDLYKKIKKVKELKNSFLKSV